MKAISIILSLALAGAVFGQSGNPFEYNQEAFQLTQKYSIAGQAAESPSGGAQSSELKSPGKAMLLSAIIPGAGELYAGSTLKAILFFGIEVGAWTGVAIYQAEGNDKEDQFKDYADNHWSKARYWTWLESLTNWNDPGVEPIYYQSLDFDPFDGYFYPASYYEQFEDDNNFTHNLPTLEDQQYYEMIGKYMTQFGPGWDDVWEGYSIDNPPPYEGENNFHWGEADYTSNSVYYMDLRYESNQALDKAAYFFQAVMLNHLISALDAGFTVRMKNRKIQTAMNIEPKYMNGEALTMGKITISW